MKCQNGAASKSLSIVNLLYGAILLWRPAAKSKKNLNWSFAGVIVLADNDLQPC